MNLGIVTALGSLVLAGASAQAMTALEAAQAIAGEYQGEWRLYWMSPQGSIHLKSEWKDVLIATDPVQGDGEAHVTAEDIMMFSDGRSARLNFLEGFTENPDGTAEIRFFEIGGQRIFEREVSEKVWRFEQTVSAEELRQMGFRPADVLFAQHVTLKAVTREGTIETEKVTRKTTIRWRSEGQTEKSQDYLSLEGYHTRGIR